MPACEVCGGHSERAFQLMLDGTRHQFDSAECAIHAATVPRQHCGCLHHSSASMQTVGSGSLPGGRGHRFVPKRRVPSGHSISKT